MNIIVGVFILLLALSFPVVASAYTVRTLNIALVTAVAVIGLNFIFGYTGLISLGHAAFMGLGGYLSALITVRVGLSFWLALVLVIFVTAIVSLLISIPLLRLSGHYLALATLGLNVTFVIILENLASLTGGGDGISGIPAPNLFGLALDGEISYYYFLLCVLAVLTLIAYRIRRSYVGQAMMAVRDNEVATSVAGVNVFRIKIISFVLGGVYAGIAGSLYAHLFSFISPSDFAVSQSIVFFGMLIVGGEGTIFGAILGAILLSLLPEWLRFLGQGYLVIFGTLVLLCLVVAPKGLAATPTYFKIYFGQSPIRLRLQRITNNIRSYISNRHNPGKERSKDD